MRRLEGCARDDTAVLGMTLLIAQRGFFLNKRRVVVTGLGMVTPLGHTVASTWQAILAGKSGVSLIDHFDASDLSCQICSRVKNFDPLPYMPEKEARKRDYFIQYGMAAAMQAIEDSGLKVTEANAHRIGLAVGSGIGGLPSIEKHHSILLESGPRRVSPFFIPGALINMICGQSFYPIRYERAEYLISVCLYDRYS